jgi:pimeloyl-ACP methyl ester carboxylesterase
MSTVVCAQDKYFDSNGVRIRYLDQGSGQPIVLIHGYTSNVERSWMDTGVFANLVKDYRVIALDCRGHGKSDKPRDPRAYGGEMGQDVVRLLDFLNISRAHIVGYSMGGNITAQLLTTNPDRFITATLGGASGRREAWGAQSEQAAEEEAVELENGIPFRSLILRVAPIDEPKPTDEAIRQRSQAMVAVNDTAALAAFMRGRRAQLVTDAQMAAVQVPTLGIVGSADPNLTGMNSLKTIWPALKVIIIEGATHAGERGAQRRPEFVNAIREFITAHTQSSSH